MGFERHRRASASPPWCRRSAASSSSSRERYLDAECLTIGPGVKTGMPIRIENPLEVGADRLVNAVAAYERFGEACVVGRLRHRDQHRRRLRRRRVPRRRDRPRPRDLAHRADRARRPDHPDRPRRAAGQRSAARRRAAIQSGFIFGFAGLIDGIVRRIEEELRETAAARHRRLAAVVVPFTRDDRRGRRHAYPEGPAPDP